MRAFFVRELIVATRSPALTLVVCAHVVAAAAFVLVWHRGVPVMAGANIYEQERLVDWWLLAVMLPWTAARCLAPDRREDLVAACALAALRPSLMVVARTAAVTIVLALVVLTGTPVAIIAQQMAAVPLTRALVDLGPFAGLTVLASGVTVAWMLLVRDRLTAWAGATISVGATLVVLARWRRSGLLSGPIGGPISGLISGLIGLAVIWALAAWSDGALRYVDE